MRDFTGNGTGMSHAYIGTMRTKYGTERNKDKKANGRSDEREGKDESRFFIKHTYGDMNDGTGLEMQETKNMWVVEACCTKYQ